MSDSAQADLFAFHTKAFGRAFVLDTSQEDTGAGFEDEEDSLGCYSDGVKRTLTDQEISIFRHSEIHALLRQRDAAKEEAKDTENKSVEPGANKESGPKPPTQSPLSRTMLEGAESDNDEKEYRQFLEKEQKEFAADASRRREKSRQSYESNDRTVSTRRKVREMDAVDEAEQILDY